MFPRHDHPAQTQFCQRSYFCIHIEEMAVSKFTTIEMWIKLEILKVKMYVNFLNITKLIDMILQSDTDRNPHRYRMG